MSKTLVFIPTAFHFESFKKLDFDWEQLAVFSHDTNVISLAKEYSEVFDLTDFMSESEINENVEKSMDLLHFWASEMQDKVIHHGNSLGEYLVVDQYFFVASFLNMDLSLPRLFDSQQPKQILLFQEFFKPDFCALPNTYFPDGLNGVVAWHASQRKIELSLLPGLDFTDHHSAFIHKLISENTNHFSEEPIIIDSQLLPQIELFDLKKFKRRILLIGFSMETHDQGLLFNYLKEDPETLLVFACLQNTPMLQYSPSFLAVDLRLIKFWPFDLTQKYELIESLRKQFYEGNTPLHQRYPNLFKNRFFDFQFDFFFNSLKDGVRIVEAMNLLNSVFQPDLVLAGGSSTLGGVRVAVETFNQMKIPTLGIMHGTAWLAHHLRRMPFPFQHFAVRGEQQVEKVAKNVPRQMDISCIGDLREHLQVSEPSTEMSHYLNLHFPKEDNRPAVLFVTATFVLGFGEIVASPSKHIQTWELLTQLANQRKDLRFFIKPHPGYDLFQFYEQISHPHSMITLLDRNVSITKVIEQVAAVVCVNMYSSTMLEAAFLGKPFLYLRDACFKSSPLHFEEVAKIPDLVVEDVHELESVLDRILQDADFKQNLLQLGNQLMQGLTSYTGDEALKKTIVLIDHLIAENPVSQFNNDVNFGNFLFVLVQNYLHFLQTGQQTSLNEIIRPIYSQLKTEKNKISFQNYLNLIKLSLTS